MQYKYLAGWTKEDKHKGLVFRGISKYEDQYSIEFDKHTEILQLNLSSQDCFVFFTQNRTLPFTPSNELAIFNDHLIRAELIAFTISESDRIIYVNFNKVDIYNNKQVYKMIVELIPRYQNIILTRKEKSKLMILDCIRKVSFAENKQRQILPGLEYTKPETNFNNEKSEIIFPLNIASKGQIKENSENLVTLNSINDLLEELYYNWILKARNEKIRNDMIKAKRNKTKKLQKKILKQKTELDTAKKEVEWKQRAELLKANFAALKKGMSSIVLLNYYETDYPELEIELNPEKNAKQNIEYYFKKYHKARDGKTEIKKQIKIAEKEIELLEKDIFELREKDDLFIKQKKHQSVKQAKTGYKKISVYPDWEIFIGRTSKENDELTTRFAKPHDWWFHTRVFRGTHVILRNYNRKELPKKLKFICSQLAAYYSKAKKSSNVPVDHTQIRFVRKPRGSAPGYVVYTEQKTLFVDPLSIREAAEKLKKEINFTKKL
ncbi:MAG: NFACT RNA binding domain-containing protein [Candidatus Cloacimonetes bacterium]|nr:NFACT RNA binding domain-containing protein [Candidatus Cloacimonadota bacterium]